MTPDFLLSIPIAHRGLHNHIYPENSMGAFENAVTRGFPIELDVHMVSDGSIVVFHDDDLLRMTGVNLPTCRLDRKTLKNYKLNHTGYSIPLFSQVLDLVQGKVGLLIEIKSGKYPGKLEKELCRLLSSYDGAFAIQSFSPFAIARVRRINPSFSRGILASDFKDDPHVDGYKKFVSKNFLFNFISKPHFIAYDIDAFPSSKVERMRFEGMPVLAYTINNQEKLEKSKTYSNNIIFERIIDRF